MSALIQNSFRLIKGVDNCKASLKLISLLLLVQFVFFPSQAFTWRKRDHILIT